MRIRFGDVLFDADARQLFCGESEARLSAKAFELLRLLIERRPAALSKATLQDHLWPDVFVSETNLPALVNEVRRAIGDDARQPRFVVTLHGFGYAFRGTTTGDVERPSSFWLSGVAGTIPLSHGENVLGRDAIGALRLDSPTVSRHHARIVVVDQTATIEDLGSKNRTFVNSKEVTSLQPLAEGDQIRVGSFVLTLRSTGAGVSTVTERGPGSLT